MSHLFTGWRNLGMEFVINIYIHYLKWPWTHLRTIYPLLGTLGTLILHKISIVYGFLNKVMLFIKIYGTSFLLKLMSSVIFFMTPPPPVSSYVIFSDTPPMWMTEFLNSPLDDHMFSVELFWTDLNWKFKWITHDL